MRGEITVGGELKVNFAHLDQVATDIKQGAGRSTRA